MATDEQAYTVSTAARRAGCSVSTVRSWIRQGRVGLVSRSRPLLVRAIDIDRLRAERLALYEDVQDLKPDVEVGRATGKAQGEDRQVSDLKERIATLEAQLRDVIASRATVNDGLQLLLRGEQGLLDAVLATLPQDERALWTAAPQGRSTRPAG